MRLALIFLAALLTIGAAPGVGSPALAQVAPFRTSEPHRMPFATRAEWLTFVRGTPDGAAAAAHYAMLFSEQDYARYRAGVRTYATRFRYDSDGRSVRGLMVAPRTPGPHPVIIYNHGGVMQWSRIIVPEVLEFHRLAERGYLVLASSYRGEGGSEGEPSMDGGDVADVVNLLDLVRAIPGADPKRVGMWGFSRGGLVTYGVLARTRAIRAAVIVGGPTDLAGSPRRAEFDRFVYPHVIRDYARDKEGALNRLSPIRWPERLAPDTPLLLLQGGDDPRVQPVEALRMAVALQQLQRPYRLKLYEGGGHDLLENWPDVRREIDRWFDDYVRDGKPAPRNGVTSLPADADGLE